MMPTSTLSAATEIGIDTPSASATYRPVCALREVSDKLVQNFRQIITTAHVCAPGGGKRAHFIRMRQSPGKGFAPRWYVGGWDQQPGLAVFDRFRDAANPARHHRYAEAERLDLRHPKRLVGRRHHHELAPRIERRQVAHQPRKTHVSFQAEIPRLVAYRPLERSLARDYVAQIRKAQAREHFEHDQVALLLAQHRRVGQAARRKAGEAFLEAGVERLAAARFDPGKADARAQHGDAGGLDARVGQQAPAHLLARHERAVEKDVVGPRTRQAVLVSAHAQEPRTLRQCSRRYGADVGVVPAVAKHGVRPPFGKHAAHAHQAGRVQAVTEFNPGYRNLVLGGELADAARGGAEQSHFPTPVRKPARLLQKLQFLSAEVGRALREEDSHSNSSMYSLGTWHFTEGYNRPSWSHSAGKAQGCTGGCFRTWARTRRCSRSRCSA